MQPNVRELGQSTIRDFVAALRRPAQARIRASMGLRDEPPAPCTDPAEAYFPIGGMARQLHGDLAPMLIGGLGSLLLQMLHPLAMSGVADHSRYQHDPLGRLEQTANFLGTTTFGSRTDSLAVIERVKAVHARVRGTSPDGVAYDASDPHLLDWVHVAEVTMFLEAARRYGPVVLRREQEDAYVAEMARVAVDLGDVSPPTTVAELNDRLEGFRPELRLLPSGKTARDFVLRGVAKKPGERIAYTTFVAGAVALLPPWARAQLELPKLPLVDSLVVRPAAMAATLSLRLVVPRPPDVR